VEQVGGRVLVTLAAVYAIAVDNHSKSSADRLGGPTGGAYLAGHSPEIVRRVRLTVVSSIREMPVLMG
jgi:hypothetical protein